MQVKTLQIKLEHNGESNTNAQGAAGIAQANAWVGAHFLELVTVRRCMQFTNKIKDFVDALKRKKQIKFLEVKP